MPTDGISSKEILFKVLEEDRLYLSQQIIRKLFQSNYSTQIFNEGVELEILEVVDTTPLGRFYILDPYK